jgi:hypothetical protein
MITEYRPVTWNAGEPVSGPKLATMAANDQFLFESMPQILFNNQGAKKDRGVKIYAMMARVNPNSTNYARVTVYFGDLFAVGCKPVVVNGLNSTTGGERYLVNIRGIGQDLVDHRGCVVSVFANHGGGVKENIKSVVWIPLVIIGF